jgi:flavin reductase (DIM6/NTAB) family NADH-FMN oxidoreductase RutF
MCMECEVVSLTPAGDHQIVVLQVHGVMAEEAHTPLVYHGRRFHTLNSIA